jgi:hypothetical protein
MRASAIENFLKIGQYLMELFTKMLRPLIFGTKHHCIRNRYWLSQKPG